LTPKVHDNGEISMHVEVEISSVVGNVNLGGISQPIISQEKVIHDIRMKDGEVNLLGGLKQSQDSTTLTGIPGLSSIPVIKWLFSSKQVSKSSQELLIALIPHIVRRPDYTEEEMRTIAVGNATVVKLNYAHPQTDGEPAPKAGIPPNPGASLVTSPTSSVNPPAAPPAPRPAPPPHPASPSGRSASRFGHAASQRTGQLCAGPRGDYNGPIVQRELGHGKCHGSVFRAPANQVRSQGAEAHRRGTRQSDVQRRPAGDLHQEYPQRHRRGRYHSEPPSGHWRRHRLGHAAHALVHYPGARHYQRFDPGLQSQQLARPTHIQLLAASDGYCEVRDETQESEGTDFGGTGGGFLDHADPD